MLNCSSFVSLPGSEDFAHERLYYYQQRTQACFITKRYRAILGNCSVSFGVYSIVSSQVNKETSSQVYEPFTQISLACCQLSVQFELSKSRIGWRDSVVKREQAYFLPFFLAAFLSAAAQYFAPLAFSWAVNALASASALASSSGAA